MAALLYFANVTQETADTYRLPIYQTTRNPNEEIKLTVPICDIFHLEVSIREPAKSGGNHTQHLSLSLSLHDINHALSICFLTSSFPFPILCMGSSVHVKPSQVVREGDGGWFHAKLCPIVQSGNFQCLTLKGPFHGQRLKRFSLVDDFMLPFKYNEL